MTKTKPTAKEVILQLKTTIKNLEAQVTAATDGSVERTLQTQDLLERCRVLRSHLAHSDTAFTNAQLHIAELEAQVRQVQHEKLEANTGYFQDLKSFQEQQSRYARYVNIYFVISLGGFLALLFGR